MLLTDLPEVSAGSRRSWARADPVTRCLGSSSPTPEYREAGGYLGAGARLEGSKKTAQGWSSSFCVSGTIVSMMCWDLPVRLDSRFADPHFPPSHSTTLQSFWAPAWLLLSPQLIKDHEQGSALSFLQRQLYHALYIPTIPFVILTSHFMKSLTCCHNASPANRRVRTTRKIILPAFSQGSRRSFCVLPLPVIPCCQAPSNKHTSTSE